MEMYELIVYIPYGTYGDFYPCENSYYETLEECKKRFNYLKNRAKKLCWFNVILEIREKSVSSFIFDGGKFKCTYKTILKEEIQGGFKI